MLLILALPILWVFDVLLGSVTIPVEEIGSLISGASIDKAHEIILLQSRIPKAFTAVIVGASLSLAGLLMQTLFRNPLAGPYILGVSSGAGLGVAILVMGATWFGFQVHYGLALNLASMLGSISVLLILFAVSLKVKDIMTLLILGIMLGAVATAFIGIIQYFTADAQLKSFLIWTLGSLEGLSSNEIIGMTVVLLVGFVLALSINKSLNMMLMGEHYAKTLGVNLVQKRLMIILISGLLAGMVTAYCGPIGFIGIVIPHICRLWFHSSSHQILLPASLLMGANVLLLSDILCRIPSNGVSLPINSVTAILGVPVILWILLRRKKLSSAF